MNKTTRIGLKERQDTPQVLNNSVELLNAMNRQTHNNRDDSMSDSLVGCGYNFRKEGRMSAHNVFVLDVNGRPLTPTTNAKARRLLKGKQAKPVWNKFSQFGIQILTETRKEVPKVVLGMDFGTKFEGYSLISGKENLLNVMWELPDKKKLVKKLKERARLRRARRYRNCRRRKCRFNNRERKGFIAPSQLQVVNSRLKCIKEFFKCYPIQKVVIEDIKFNHRDKRYGKNFTTVEVGKKKIFDCIITSVGVENLILFSGVDTQLFREKNKLRKSSDKSVKNFYSHCVDSFVIANELSNTMPNESIIYADDTYRPTRRRLHDTQPTKGNIRVEYSSGNFKGIRKGTMCEYGQICGGTEKVGIWYQDWSDIPQKGKSLKKISWLSHNYKSMVITG